MMKMIGPGHSLRTAIVLGLISVSTAPFLMSSRHLAVHGLEVRFLKSGSKDISGEATSRRTIN